MVGVRADSKRKRGELVRSVGLWSLTILSVVLNLLQWTSTWQWGEGRKVASSRGDYDAWVWEMTDANPITSSHRTTAKFEVKPKGQGEEGVRIEIMPATANYYPDTRNAIVWAPDGESVVLKFDRGEVRLDTHGSRERP